MMRLRRSVQRAGQTRPDRRAPGNCEDPGSENKFPAQRVIPHRNGPGKKDFHTL